MTPTIDEQFAAAGQRIDAIEARARLGGTAPRRRSRRRVSALRHERANAVAAARRDPDHAVEHISRLMSRIEVAERSLDADLALDRSAFSDGVAAELSSWDRFAERLQTAAAARTGQARERAEAAIRELRRRRLAVADRLNELRAARREAWPDQRVRVTAARDDLERMEDHLMTYVFKKENEMNLASHNIKRVRWALGINGAVSVAFGVMILAWPDISLYALTLLFGAYALVNGVVHLASLPGTREGRGWTALSGVLGICVGIAVLLWPSISALGLLYVIAAYAITFGVIGIGGAFWLPISTGDAVLLSVGGLVSIVFGLVMFAAPGEGALVLLALIAAFSLVTGVTQLVVAIGGRRFLNRQADRLAGAAA